MLTILWQNRQRLHRVYRPTIGKTIAVIALALLLPTGLFTFLPTNALTVLRLSADAGVAMPASALIRGIGLPSLAAAILVPPLIYGIRNRLVRVALLFGVWVAGYGWQILLSGLYIGPVTL